MFIQLYSQSFHTTPQIRSLPSSTIPDNEFTVTQFLLEFIPLLKIPGNRQHLEKLKSSSNDIPAPSPLLLKQDDGNYII